MSINKVPNVGITPVILSGGSGSRLWPVSRSSFPKQYLNFDNSNNYTLLQNTFLRLRGLKNLQKPVIICNQEQRFIASDQMKYINVDVESILLEPCGRNTAPAIALASLATIKENDPVLLILSSDHKIVNTKQFQLSIEEAIEFAEKGYIVTFGVVPKSPEIGFGYIESLEKVSTERKISKIKRFVEKPSLEIAQQLIKDKHYLWNSGMFIAKASTIISEMQKFNPQIINNCKKALERSTKDLNFIRINKDLFQKCPNISIDKAIMEKTTRGVVIPLDAGWNDLGTWKSIWEEADVDDNKNTLLGKTYIKDVKNSFFRSDKRLLVGLGLENILIVDTDDTLLVANKKSVHLIKEVVKELEDRNYSEISENQKVFRPWGNYETFIEGEKWKVKKLEINPNESLSLQLHNYRSEHWIVVKGTAKIEINGETKYLQVNESIYVPLGAKHRLSNENNTLLTLIEVQTGNYLGEDDIVRFEDKYKR